MTMIYFDRSREADPHALPDCEIFHVSESQATANSAVSDNDDNCYCTEPGWYWWPCFPGCLPDGDPVGPFATHEIARDDAQDGGDFDVCEHGIHDDSGHDCPECLVNGE